LVWTSAAAPSTFADLRDRLAGRQLGLELTEAARRHITAEGFGHSADAGLTVTWAKAHQQRHTATARAA
jgi:plastocyanin